jgi:hypothetical protein
MSDRPTWAVPYGLGLRPRSSVSYTVWDAPLYGSTAQGPSPVRPNGVTEAEGMAADAMENPTWGGGVSIFLRRGLLGRGLGFGYRIRVRVFRYLAFRLGPRCSVSGPRP